MSIIRAPRPQANFVIVDKRTTENSRLSWAARGLATFIQGKPDHWRVSVSHLRKQTASARIKTGRDGIYALLKELKEAGYITTRQTRRQDGTQGEVEYLFHEEPLPAQPEAVEPCTAQPDTAGTTQESNERATSTDALPRTDSSKKITRAMAPNAEAFAPSCPPDVEPGTWAAYLVHRLAAGVPVDSQDAQNQVARKLAKVASEGGDANEALRRAIAKPGQVMPLGESRTAAEVIAARLEAKHDALLTDLDTELALRETGGRPS